MSCNDEQRWDYSCTLIFSSFIHSVHIAATTIDL